MNWLKLSQDKSQKEYEELKNKIDNSNINSIKNIKEYDLRFENLRNDIYRIFYEVINELKISEENVSKIGYTFDYNFALKFYFLLNDEYGFNTYLASDNGIWRYLQLKVCPYIVLLRWGDSIDHIYLRSSRMWFKTLWWYIYIAWRNDIDTTKKILEVNNSDTLVQLVERTGKYGYRIELYNEILYKRIYYKINSVDFKKLMVLNTMRVKVIDPYLVEGGLTKYVDELYNDVYRGEK